MLPHSVEQTYLCGHADHPTINFTVALATHLSDHMDSLVSHPASLAAWTAGTKTLLFGWTMQMHD